MKNIINTALEIMYPGISTLCVLGIIMFPIGSILMLPFTTFFFTPYLLYKKPFLIKPMVLLVLLSIGYRVNLYYKKNVYRHTGKLNVRLLSFFRNFLRFPVYYGTHDTYFHLFLNTDKEFLITEHNRLIQRIVSYDKNITFDIDRMMSRIVVIQDMYKKLYQNVFLNQFNHRLQSFNNVIEKRVRDIMTDPNYMYLNDELKHVTIVLNMYKRSTSGLKGMYGSSPYNDIGNQSLDIICKDLIDRKYYDRFSFISNHFLDIMSRMKHICIKTNNIDGYLWSYIESDIQYIKDFMFAVENKYIDFAEKLLELDMSYNQNSITKYFNSLTVDNHMVNFLTKIIDDRNIQGMTLIRKINHRITYQVDPLTNAIIFDVLSYRDSPKDPHVIADFLGIDKLYSPDDLISIKENVCIICYGIPNAILGCGHPYCLNCMYRWFFDKETKKCVMCFSRFEYPDVRLYLS